MAHATYVKEVKTKAGKAKFQAQVWFQGEFYCAKTFDLESLARTWKEEQLKEIVRGKLFPAKVRAVTRQAESLLDLPMTHWASLYIKQVKHGKSRLAEYELVGRLVADKSLRDFSGKDGARLIKQLLANWRNSRQPRSHTPRPENAPPFKPLGDQTLRLRYFALMRLLSFGMDELPEKAQFEMPVPTALFNFTPPPAYSAPREREPSDEEFAKILGYVGVNSELGEFLRVIDETGCRLGEVRKATGANVHFFYVAGQVVGGHLTLIEHKTSMKIGTREVPLSLFAARLLNARKHEAGDSLLFPGLGTTGDVCKKFDEIAKALEMTDLLIKDWRRAFVNRNKYRVAHMDMMKIVGNSSLLDPKDRSPSERATSEALGHCNFGTSAGYSHPRLQELAHMFTQTSRWPRLGGKLRAVENAPQAFPDARPDVDALQRQLLDTLEQLSRAGITGMVGVPALA